MATYLVCAVALWIYAGYSGWKSAVEPPKPLPKAVALGRWYIK